MRMCYLRWLLAMSLLFTVLSATMAYAGEISVDFPKEPTVTKTVKWGVSGGAEEYRYLPGAHGEEGFAEAESAGGGSQASITVDENGSYTLYAKTGDKIYYIQIPITTIDHNPPTIRITDIISTSDLRISVFYEIDDYYGVKEVRYRSGNVPESGFSSAKPVSGGVIEGLTEGTYTLYAQDLAGNITTYSMAVTSDYSETQWSSEYETSYETHESTEWDKSDLWVEPSATRPTEPPPETMPPETTPPESQETTTEEETTDKESRPHEPPTRPEPPGYREPSVPPGTSPVPTNPVVPPANPPIERFPQTGSMASERLMKTGAVLGLCILGGGLLLYGRYRGMKGLGKEDDEKHPEEK